MLNNTEFYERLAGVFDVMTDWPARLAVELPFIQRQLESSAARRVLDVACGTGWHAISLAQRGYTCAGCDASPAMIERARANAAKSDVKVDFRVADLARLSEHFTPDFDAILCLGNSLPHLLSQPALQTAITEMRAVLAAGGVLMVHNLNYDMRLKTQPRFFAASGQADTLVWRFADYMGDSITFHTALFEHSPAGWSVQVNSTPQHAWLARDLDEALAQAGFANIRHYGGLDGSPYNADISGDLVITAS